MGLLLLIRNKILMLLCVTFPPVAHCLKTLRYQVHGDEMTLGLIPGQEFINYPLRRIRLLHT